MKRGKNESEKKFNKIKERMEEVKVAKEALDKAREDAADESKVCAFLQPSSTTKGCIGEQRPPLGPRAGGGARTPGQGAPRKHFWGSAVREYVRRRRGKPIDRQAGATVAACVWVLLRPGGERVSNVGLLAPASRCWFI